MSLLLLILICHLGMEKTVSDLFGHPTAENCLLSSDFKSQDTPCPVFAVECPDSERRGKKLVFSSFGGFSYMTFILVPSAGEDLQVNAWNWRPTLELLFAANVITEEDRELMGCQGCGGKVDAKKTSSIADIIGLKLESMNRGERMLANLSVVQTEKKRTVFAPNMNAADVDANELYSTTYEWLETFAKFCRSSGGFEVM